jgi:hypothetical protein
MNRRGGGVERSEGLGRRKKDEAVSICSHLTWRAATKATFDWPK